MIISVLRFLSNPIPTKLFPLATLAGAALPDVVEVVGGGVNELGFVGQDAGFEIAVAFAFHAYACSSKVGGADIDLRAVEDHQFEMYSRTQPSLQPRPQAGILVEIFTEVLTRLFGVQQPHLDTVFQQPVKYGEEGLHLAASLTYIEVFEVGGANPQVVLHLRAAG